MTPLTATHNKYSLRSAAANAPGRPRGRRAGTLTALVLCGFLTVGCGSGRSKAAVTLGSVDAAKILLTSTGYKPVAPHRVPGTSIRLVYPTNPRVGRIVAQYEKGPLWIFIAEATPQTRPIKERGSFFYRSKQVVLLGVIIKATSVPAAERQFNELTHMH